eukprot:15328248-Ditylum_brightwellii.AAC.1
MNVLSFIQNITLNISRHKCCSTTAKLLMTLEQRLLLTFSISAITDNNLQLDPIYMIAIAVAAGAAVAGNVSITTKLAFGLGVDILMSLKSSQRS